MGTQMLLVCLVVQALVAQPLEVEKSSHRNHKRKKSCWDEDTGVQPSSFLEAASGIFDLTSPAVQSWNWFTADKKASNGQSPDKWAEVLKLGVSGPGSETKGAGFENAWPGKGLDFSLWGPILGEMPGFAGALFGRSLFSGCKCEACVYSVDTLVMYLDEDTMGMFDEQDIDRILMDRFCYGIKWMYRSACHHIMSNYYEDVTDMIMTYYTGWDICRQLRMCPWFLNDPINAYESPSLNPYPSLGKLPVGAQMMGK
jgi:hypothetical protein